ncbi:MAG TPA: ATP-binding cassette domain-containing protein [Candidatus Polarisedimenticolaceae bacterium]|nr:ATP-binding cassette domain-containing protein [Candidatus Polarisedimenticolaceae bacterium]
MSIVLDQITKRFDRHAIVNQVSLEIADGELLVLLGPSGSGKSTILRMIAGLTPCDHGRVVLHGRDVTKLPPQKRGVGIVFQHYALFRNMSVAENIEFALRIRRVAGNERRRRREELLELVDLAGLGGRMPGQLSGGQQQRVALARALAHHPEVLLLDEPFGALDAKIRADLRRAVHRIQRELGVAAVFVTHDQEEAFEVADRLGVLHQGRLLEVGPPKELYARPRTEFVARFLGAANLIVGINEPNGVRIGPCLYPLKTQGVERDDAPRVQVLFRPEDVAVKDTPDALEWPLLGEAVVEDSSFFGSIERLRLRLPDLVGVRMIEPPPAFGEAGIVVEASRSQHQARRYPLAPGDSAWVGLRRIHALPHPGLRLLAISGPEAGAKAAVERAVALAARADARLTVLAADGAPVMEGVETRRLVGAWDEAVAREAERDSVDLVVAAPEPESAPEIVTKLMKASEHHVLVVRSGAAPFERALLCVAGGEQGKVDVLFAGRLLRHVGADVTVLMAVPAEPADPAAEAHAERFLAAAVKTLASAGVTARTSLAHGDPATCIETEAASGRYGLIVLGAPLRSDSEEPFGGVVGRLLSSHATPSILVVRSGGP